MIEVVSSALTYFGLLLASELWQSSGRIRVLRFLSVLLALVVVVGQSWWLARRRHALPRIVVPPGMAAALATFTSVWLSTRSGARCDDCSLLTIFLIPPLIAALVAVLVAILIAGIVRARRGAGGP